MAGGFTADDVPQLLSRFAQEIQLMMEYAPAPPFHAGSPKTAPADIVQRVTAARQAIQEERHRSLSQIGRRPD